MLVISRWFSSCLTIRTKNKRKKKQCVAEDKTILPCVRSCSRSCRTRSATTRSRCWAPRRWSRPRTSRASSPPSAATASSVFSSSFSTRSPISWASNDRSGSLASATSSSRWEIFFPLGDCKFTLLCWESCITWLGMYVFCSYAWFQSCFFFLFLFVMIQFGVK